jgi:WXXGXW repeat (2 copies)
MKAETSVIECAMRVGSVFDTSKKEIYGEKLHYLHWAEGHRTSSRPVEARSCAKVLRRRLPTMEFPMRILRKIVKTVGPVLPALLLCAIPAASPAQISVGFSITARVMPPVLPVYVQPPCPTEGYLWTPGYWSYDPVDGYYWVPGVWVAPPEPGVLWTPGYWGYANGVYGWNDGYWGPTVGFYGGVNYGFGYGGEGFYGGRWEGNQFRYNTAVVRVNTTVIHNVYVDRTVIRTETSTRASFNGPGGVNRRPTPQEEQAAHEHHYPRTEEQTQHISMAKADPQARYSTNHGRPAVTAEAKVGERSTVAANRTESRPAARTESSRPATTRSTESRPEASRTEPTRPATTRPESTRSKTTARTESTHPESTRSTATARTEATRPESTRSTTTARTSATHPATTGRTETAPRTESRPATKTLPAVTHPATPARTEARTETAPRTESRPAAKPKPAPKPEATPRAESRPAPAPKPEAAPRAESRPAPAPKAEAAPRAESRPAPAPKPASRPAPTPKAAPAPKAESRPAPAPKAAPAAKPAARPAPAPKPAARPEKEKPQQ